MGCRKNVARLTPAERAAFVNAVLALKANGRYDPYVEMHRGAGQHGHGGPAFFPWHREYLMRFENELQAIDPSVNIPYWDWTVDNLNGAGTESLIWRDDVMGGPGGAPSFLVTTGPFAGWGLRRSAFDIFQFPGGGGAIAGSMAELRYGDFIGIEGPHGAPHVWTGGDVGVVSTAARDPVFWLLHANVDRLWAEWTNRHRTTAGWVQYEPTVGGPAGHSLNDTMWPWNGTTTPFGLQPWVTIPEQRHPADLLEHRVHDTFYDTLDPECRRRVPKGFRPKEFIKEKELFKERLPKELIKDRLPKELGKDRLPKELGKDRLPKELGKDRDPKEFKDIREVPGKPAIREQVDPGIFIRPELRPDLTGAALGFEPDVLAEMQRLQARADELGGASDQFE